MGRREEVIEVSTRIAEMRKELARLERRLDELLRPKPEREAELDLSSMMVAEPAALSTVDAGRLLASAVRTVYHVDHVVPAPDARPVSARIVEYLDQHMDQKFSPVELARALAVSSGSVRVALHRLKTDRKVAYHGRGEFCSLRHVCEEGEKN
jgi:hypothetical protein